MTHPFQSVAIVGLGLIGSSIARAVHERLPDVRLTGFAAVALKAGRKTPDAKVLSKPFHLRDLVAEVERMFMTEDQHGRL